MRATLKPASGHARGVSKRRSATPRAAPRKPRDRRQLFMALLAVAIVLSMLLSGLLVLFYGN